MSKEDRIEMLEAAFSDWLMMFDSGVPPKNARKQIYIDYDLTEQEKEKIQGTMLLVLEERR